MSARAAPGGLAARLGEHELVICAGAGGVGKTTVSAALAMAIVAEQDKRVMVLTVDPAKRLAAALGMRSMGPEPVTVPASRMRRAGVSPRGELVAAMLDTKSSWDRVIERHAPSRQSAMRIKASPFYKGLSSAFVGSDEYMAMENLYELHSGGEYDCVVVDTPPSRNALDFLEAPERVSDFVGARLLSWLAGPSRIGWRAMNFAATPFLRMADRLLGSDVLAELAAFVGEIQGIYAGVQQRGREIKRLMQSPRSAFTVVTTLEPAPFAEAEFFCAKLRELSMPLRAVVVNRVLPAELRAPDGLRAACAMEDDGGVAVALSSELGRRVATADLRHVAQAYLLLHHAAERDARQIGRLSRLGRVPAVELPLHDREVSDVETLALLAERLRAS